MAFPCEDPVDVVEHPAHGVPEPLGIGFPYNTPDLDLPSRQIDDEEDVMSNKTTQSDDLDGEEVATTDGSPVRLEGTYSPHPVVISRPDRATISA